MEYIDYILLPLIAFLAFIVKAMTGFGPAIVVISLGSLIIAPHTIIATSAILDFLAGMILLRLDWSGKATRFWLPLAAAIVIGSVLGAVFLKLIPPSQFNIMLAIVIFLLGLWFAFGRDGTNTAGLRKTLKNHCSTLDVLFTFVGGVCGGLFGISGPPIIWHFGRQYAKTAFRQIVVPIFLAAAVARIVTYSAVGIVNVKVLAYVAAGLPGLLLGLFVGNKIFYQLSEKLFSRIVAVILIAVAVKLLV